MDSTVVQEIANQLGMAADQAGQFIIEQLPNYAALKVVQMGMPIAIIWAVFFVFAAVSITSIALCHKWAKKAKADEEKYEKEKMESEKYLPYGNDYVYKRFKTYTGDYTAYRVFIITGVIAAFAAFIGMIATIVCAPYIYGWMSYPESMLLDMAIQAVG